MRWQAIRFLLWACCFIELILFRRVRGFSTPRRTGEAPPSLPTTPDQIARAAATSIHAAMMMQQGGIYRQTIKLPLSDGMYGSKAEGFVADRAIGWQGGPQETIRYLAPLTEQVLQRLAVLQAENTGGLTARIQSQTLLDFDGTCLLTTEHPAGAIHDVQALLQPNTDQYYRNTIQSMQAAQETSTATAKQQQRLILLVNPAWRDRNSWGILDGRSQAQTQILDRFPVTFALDEFVVRGTRISRYYCCDPSSETTMGTNRWLVFRAPLPYAKSENNNINNGEAEYLGSFEEKPNYEQVDQLLLLKKKQDSEQQTGR